MNVVELRAKLATKGLNRYFDRLKPLLRSTIRLCQTSTPEEQIKIGQTKIGGRPDLPPTIGWVTETNRVVTTEKRFLVFHIKKEETITKPLSFIAQINLSEVTQFDIESLLPENGILYFFYSAEQEAWGFDFLDRNKFKVFYYDGSLSDLVRTDYPKDLPEDARYKACSVSVHQEISLPSSYQHEVYNVFTEQETDEFWQEVYNEENINKLLGYADAIQNEMELECELVTNGLYCGDPSGYNDPKAKKLAPNAENWLLLLQIDSNEENGMMWGDCGRLYFWIKKDDLAHKRFSNAWFSLQCY